MITLQDYRLGGHGLGQVVGATPAKRLRTTMDTTDIRDFLRHDLVPEKPNSSIPISKITDMGQARTYAARAFHVAVDNGLSRAGTPQYLWAQAAAVYFFAWQDAKVATGGAKGITLAHVLEYLKFANAKATEAKNAGGGRVPDSTAAPSSKASPEDQKQPGQGSNKFLLYGGILGGAAGLIYLVTRKKGRR